jgi:hypothetical protein
VRKRRAVLPAFTLRGRRAVEIIVLAAVRTAMEAKGDCQRRHQERSDNSGGQLKCAEAG